MLSNAIKFTSPGGTITLSVLTHKNSEVTIKVRDNGKGISPEELKLIFEPFYQSSDVDIKTGSGIGLHYTKQLTEAMSGKISAESKLGEGSVFSVTLPVNNLGYPFPSLKMDEMLKAPSFTRNEENRNIRLSTKENSNNENGEIEMTILVVEDNKDIVLYIKSIIPAIYKVIHAIDGQEGIDLAMKPFPI